MRKNQIRQTRFRGKPQPPKSARYLTVTPDGTTQTGGLSFSRNSTGSITLPDGTVQDLAINQPGLSNGLKMRPATTNLLLHSEELNHSYWAKAVSNSTPVAVVTSDYASAPDNSATADRVQLTLPGDQDWSLVRVSNMGLSLAANAPFVQSVYVKATDVTQVGKKVSLYSYNTTTGQYGNISTAVLTLDWQRIVTKQAFPDASTAQEFSIGKARLSIGGIAGTANAETATDFLIWGAQCELGSSVTDYVPSQGTPGVRAAETATVQLPGLRQNLLAWSQDFDNATWTKLSNPIITANVAVAPDGSLTGDQINASTADGAIWPSAANDVIANGGSYTFSVWAKAVSGTQTNFKIRIRDNTANTVVASSTVTLNSSVWQRVSTTLASSTSGNHLGVNIYPGGESGTGNVYLWGAQFNTGSAALDYCPTTTSAINVPGWLSTQEGSVAFTVTPTWTGANPSATDYRYILTGNTYLAALGYIAPSNAQIQTSDGTRFPGIDAGFVSGVPVRFATRWSKAQNFLRVDNLSTGVQGTPAPFGGFPSLLSRVQVGSSGTGTAQPNATISNIVFSADPEGAQ